MEYVGYERREIGTEAGAEAASPASQSQNSDGLDRALWLLKWGGD